MLLPLICAPNLEAVLGLRHGFTTRVGGVSEGPFSSLNLGWDTGDDEDRTEENLHRVAGALGTTKRNIAGVRQSHGSLVTRVRRGFDPVALRAMEADALITDDSGVFLSIRYADCVPILLADPSSRALAAVHAGWRGTLSGVLPAAIASLRDEMGVDPSALFVAVGPAVSGENYEVSDGVASLFESRLGAGDGEVRRTRNAAFIDLRKMNCKAASDSGIRAENIWVSEWCTFGGRERFFSHRRDGRPTGRMAALIGWAA